MKLMLKKFNNEVQLESDGLRLLIFIKDKNFIKIYHNV